MTELTFSCFGAYTQTVLDNSIIVRHVLHKYVNEDVSLGAWFIGLDVEHIDDRRLCCGTPPGKPLFNSCLNGFRLSAQISQLFTVFSAELLIKHVIKNNL